MWGRKTEVIGWQVVGREGGREGIYSAVGEVCVSWSNISNEPTNAFRQVCMRLHKSLEKASRGFENNEDFCKQIDYFD